MNAYSGVMYQFVLAPVEFQAIKRILIIAFGKEWKRGISSLLVPNADVLETLQFLSEDDSQLISDFVHYVFNRPDEAVKWFQSFSDRSETKGTLIMASILQLKFLDHWPTESIKFATVFLTSEKVREIEEYSQNDLVAFLYDLACEFPADFLRWLVTDMSSVR